jgi:hypothetical protein
VCANPQGSSLTYAYIRGDGNIYTVTGCSTPRLLVQTFATHPTLLAWSPSDRYLAAWTYDTSGISRVEIIDAQTGATTQTQYGVDFGSSPNAGDTMHIFFGWLDESSFLGGIATVTNSQSGLEQAGPTRLVRVDVGSGQETTLGRITGWANIGYMFGPDTRIVAHGRYFIYAGYDSADTTGYLHRFDLTTGTDTQLVSLGMYTNGGCQGTPVCGWTAPWDVSPDGAHILYHHPGAASAPSDTGVPNDTPVLYASPDGSGASTPFGTALAAGLVAPIFSPDGMVALTTGSTYASTNPFSGVPPQMKIVRFGERPTLVTGSFETWRGDSGAVVLTSGSDNLPQLYDLATGNTTPLEANAGAYLWAN